MPPRKRAAATPRKRAAKKTPGGTELSVVPADAKPPEKPKPLTLAEAIEAGDYLEILRAQRRELVTDMRNATGPAKAAMHRQFAIQSKEIAALEAIEAERKQEAGENGDTVPDEEFDTSTL